MDVGTAIRILEAIESGELDYIEEYREYIKEHKERITKFAEGLIENFPELFDNIDIEDFLEIIEEHDLSKYSEEELEPYAAKRKKGVQNPVGWEDAWNHHWLNNKHHPEHWFGEDMPYIYILEMICDWGSFGIDNKDFKALSDFYYNEAKDDKEKNLSDNTKTIIEEILDLILKASEGEE